MKKGQVYEGVIESVEFPNKGIVNVSQEDRRVIVKKWCAWSEGTFFSK